MINIETGYVHFYRGSQSAWDSLMSTGGVKNDALYFIYDSNGTNTGKLYLGTRLISGGDSTVIESNTTLGDLIDVDLKNDEVGSVLFHDESGWTSVSFQNLIENAISLPEVITGATAPIGVEGEEGYVEGTVGSAGLVPEQPIDSVNKFLRGDATWANPTEAVEGRLNILEGDEKTEGSVKFQIQELTNLILGYGEDDDRNFELDTFKEIAEWIENQEELKEVANMNTRVSNLEEILNGKEAVKGEDGETVIIEAVPGLVDKVSELTTSVATFNSTVGNLQEALSELEGIPGRVTQNEKDIEELTASYNDINSNITSILSLLQWNELDKTV